MSQRLVLPPRCGPLCDLARAPRSRAARRLARGVLLAALLAGLAGCGSLPWTHKAPPAAASAAVTPTPAPAKPRKHRRHVAKKPAAPASKPVPDLVGLSEAQVIVQLGLPDERAETGPGVTWTYRGPSCTLRLIFFLDVTRNDYYALSRTVEGTDGGESQAQRCIEQIASHAKSS